MFQQQVLDWGTSFPDKSSPGIPRLFYTVRAACVKQQLLSHTQTSADHCLQWGGMPAQMPAQDVCRGQSKGLSCSHLVAVIPQIHMCPKWHYSCQFKLICPTSLLSKHFLSLLYSQCQMARGEKINSVLLTVLQPYSLAL